MPFTDNFPNKHPASEIVRNYRMYVVFSKLKFVLQYLLKIKFKTLSHLPISILYSLQPNSRGRMAAAAAGLAVATDDGTIGKL